MRNTRLLARLLLLALLATCTAAAAQTPQQPVPLTQWRVPKAGVRMQRDGNVLRLSAGKGWVSTDVEYLDFVLRLELRVMTPDAEGAVLLRAWEDPTNTGAMTGYRLGIAGPAATPQTALLTGFSARTQMVSGGSLPPVAVGEWHQLEIACSQDRVIVRVDGDEVGVAEGGEPQAGTIGLEASTGAIEFRQILLTPIAVPMGKLSPDPSLAPPPVPALAHGITPPRVVREVRPRYSRDAMANVVQGTVGLDVIVMPDGTVGQISIRRSLKCDLDLEAAAAARRWKFEPALRDGVPVPVIATIDLSFTLR